MPGLDSLPEIVVTLRRAADANILDGRALGDLSPRGFADQAGAMTHAVIDIRGDLVRLQFTRDRLGSRDFYHLSIIRKHGRPVAADDLAAIVAAFFPDGKVLPVRSVLGKSIQFLGRPFENGMANRN